jgi:hypothetical protein
MSSVKGVKNLCSGWAGLSNGFSLSALAALLMLLPVFLTGIVSLPGTRGPWNGLGSISLFVIVHICFGFRSGLAKQLLFLVPAIIMTSVFVCLGWFSENTVWLLGIFWAAPLFINIFSRGLLKNILIVTICVFLLQAQWGVVQFVIQRDLGMNVLGESKLSAQQNGVAKFSMGNILNDAEEGNKKIIRAYGPFSHPNSFGGVLTIGFLLILITSLRVGFGDYGVNPLSFFLDLAGPIIFLAIVLTFSRAVYVSSALGFLIYCLTLFFGRGLRARKEMLIKCLTKKILVFLLLVISLSPLIYYRLTDAEDVALPERQDGWTWAVEIIKENGVWVGLGIGQYNVSLEDYLNRKGISYDPWQIDYVHNVLLLIAAEWGLAATIVLVMTVLILVFTKLKKSWWWLVPLTPLFLFDHYFITQLYPVVILLLYFVLLKCLSFQKKISF